MCKYKIIDIGSEINNANIVKGLAKHKFVEKIVNKYVSYENAEDLAQDIYLQLLESDKTVELYLNKQLQFYIVGVVTKSAFSTSSIYYSKYLKLKNISTNIDEQRNI